jgi:hypothetical protein
MVPRAGFEPATPGCLISGLIGSLVLQSGANGMFLSPGLSYRGLFDVSPVCTDQGSSRRLLIFDLQSSYTY